MAVRVDKKVKNVRKHHRLYEYVKGTDIAEQLGVSPVTITNAFKRESNSPILEDILKLTAERVEDETGYKITNPNLLLKGVFEGVVETLLLKTEVRNMVSYAMRSEMDGIKDAMQVKPAHLYWLFKRKKRTDADDPEMQLLSLVMTYGRYNNILFLPFEKVQKIVFNELPLLRRYRNLTGEVLSLHEDKQAALLKAGMSEDEITDFCKAKHTALTTNIEKQEKLVSKVIYKCDKNAFKMPPKAFIKYFEAIV